MPIPPRFLPQPVNLRRVRLDLDRDDYVELSKRAAGCELSLASFCRVVCMLAARGQVSDDQIIRIAVPLRAAPVHEARAPEPPKKRGRPKKNA